MEDTSLQVLEIVICQSSLEPEPVYLPNKSWQDLDSFKQLLIRIALHLCWNAFEYHRIDMPNVFTLPTTIETPYDWF